MGEKYGFCVRLDHQFPEKWQQYVKVRWHQLKDLIMLGVRYFFYWIYIKAKGRTPLMDYFKVVNGQQIYGVPLGGIGSGTIGRGFKGQFCRYQLRPGIYNYETIPGNQFIVTVCNDDGKVIYQKVLNTAERPKCLKKWDWSYNGANADYRGLYPRSWTTFSIPECQLTLTCKQISPVIPDNYKDSSLPCAAFIWEIENNSASSLTVSITFTFQNGTGESSDTSPGCWCEKFSRTDNGKDVEGALIHHGVRGMDYTFSLATSKQGSSASTLIGWNPAGDGADVWTPLSQTGAFANSSAISSSPTKKGQLQGVAVCSQVQVQSGGNEVAEFALAWDMPKIHFEEGANEYYRFYTKYFGRDGKAGPLLASYALSNYTAWEKAIESWQQPTLSNPTLPAWYKSAIFNETYFVSDGGSIWLDIESEEMKRLTDNDPRREYGRFAYLEGHEYRMFNTYDVHFYASFALAMNWPKLQAVLQRDFADAIPREDHSKQWHLFDGDVCDRKKKDSIPHDLGDPGEEPFVKINAYPIHDVSEWRDLNLKYVLQVCRDFKLTKDMTELAVHWPNILTLMRGALRWDIDGDGMIENHGSADQTYDTWIMTGTSAYCGSLWLAALQSTSHLASIMQPEVVPEFETLLARAKEAFEKKLWNGQYYDFDSSGSGHSKSIMSDQLCGLWYLLSSSLPNQIVPEDHAHSALQKIYNFNVKKFGNGQIGAVNGMLPDGTVDTFTVQSEEMWCGVVYAYSALLIHHGMTEEAFSTAGGLYKLVYESVGLGYQTPEALFEKDCYRSVAYMRPLSIWSIQLALSLTNNPKL